MFVWFRIKGLFLHLLSWHAVNVVVVPTCFWCGPAYSSSVKVIAVTRTFLQALLSVWSCRFAHVIRPFTKLYSLLMWLCAWAWCSSTLKLNSRVIDFFSLLHIKHKIFASTVILNPSLIHLYLRAVLVTTIRTWSCHVSVCLKSATSEKVDQKMQKKKSLTWTQRSGD